MPRSVKDGEESPKALDFGIKEAIAEGREAYQKEVEERIEAAKLLVTELINDYDLAERAREAAGIGEKEIKINVAIFEEEELFTIAAFKQGLEEVFEAIEIKSSWKLTKPSEIRVCTHCRVYEDSSRPDGWSENSKFRDQKCNHKEVERRNIIVAELRLRW